jgi:hypothetical protein
LWVSNKRVDLIGIRDRSMKRKTYFNWYELKKDAKEEPAGILILTYALYKGYNTLLSKNANKLMTKLHIDVIPRVILKNDYVLVSKNYKELIVNYKCKEPQSYFTNGNFLTAICPVRKKLEYLYLLSMRPINDKSARIPLNYLNDEQLDWSANNPFIKTIEENIVFVPELIRNRGEKKYGIMG